MSIQDSVATTVANDRLREALAASRVPRKPRVPRRRRPLLIIAAALLVAVAVGVNVSVLTRADNRVEVLALSRDVAWGQPVTAADLHSVPTAPEALAYAIPADQTPQIVGRIASVNLLAGSVLSPRQLTAQAVPGPGQRILAVHLAAGRYPARGLHPGDGIQVLPVIGGSGSTASQSGVQAASPQIGPGFAARVVDTSVPDAGGAVTVDVLVDASILAQAATTAAGDVVVVLLGPS
jgi:hypothetical protein